MRWPDYKNRILAEIDGEAFFVDEFPNLKIRGSEGIDFCPFAKELHKGGQDNNPSFTINLDRGIYYCPVCKSKGNIHTWYKYKHKLSSDRAWLRLGDELGLERPDTVEQARPDLDLELVYKYHKTLMDLPTATSPIRKILRNRRGVTDKTLKDFLIGYDGERITIPIFDEFNTLVNIRKYRWDAPEGKQKVINHKDEFQNTYGELRIFGIEHFFNDEIKTLVWCEGEMDRIVSEQYGFATATPTSGTGTLNPRWLSLFAKKKKIILVQDNDDAGELGREELVKQISSVTEVAWIQWPKDFPVKGDITDFFTEYKGTADEYRKLLAQSITPKQFSKDTKFKHENVAQQHLADSTNPTNTGKRFKTLALVGGKTDSPYLVPKAVTFSCGDAADPEQKKCQGCACCKAGGLLVGNIGATESIMLSLLNTTDLAKKYCLLEHFNINTRCKIVEQIDVVNRKVDELVLHPKVDEMAMVAREGEYVTRKAYVVDNDVQANKKYTFYGTLTNCPKTQEAVLLFDKAIPE